MLSTPRLHRPGDVRRVSQVLLAYLCEYLRAGTASCASSAGRTNYGGQRRTCSMSMWTCGMLEPWSRGVGYGPDTERPRTVCVSVSADASSVRDGTVGCGLCAPPASLHHALHGSTHVDSATGDRDRTVYPLLSLPCKSSIFTKVTKEKMYTVIGGVEVACNGKRGLFTVPATHRSYYNLSYNNLSYKK